MLLGVWFIIYCQRFAKYICFIRTNNSTYCTKKTLVSLLIVLRSKNIEDWSLPDFSPDLLHCHFVLLEISAIFFLHFPLHVFKPVIYNIEYCSIFITLKSFLITNMHNLYYYFFLSFLFLHTYNYNIK
jgi:hypothetical protein